MLRSRAIASERIPESVLVIVYNDDSEVLLLKRRHPLEFWQSVTGSFEQDESARDAAVRELLEETGLSEEGDLIDTGESRQFEIDPRWRNRYAPNVSTNTEHEWRYRLAKSLPVQLSNAEHSEFGWFDIDSAIEFVWSWTNKEALENLKSSLQ